MLVTWYGRIAKTVDALVKVCTGGAVVTLPLKYLTRAYRTLLDKFRGVTVVQMPEDHHGCVLGAAKGIELIMVALTEIEEELAVVEKFTVHFLIVVVDDLYEATLAILGEAFGWFI
mmetsp:Transcript_5030/g.8377  ORF Transcript_5030/g.8377 Transcript_5030/m.8377 type:complete len:116 (+) Transcript_5030:457-804(+)